MQPSPPRVPRGAPVSRLLSAAVSSAALFVVSGCAEDAGPAARPAVTRMSIDALLLEDARRCDSGFEYPAALVEGISVQLVEELRCLDDSWLEFYTSCTDVGCIYASGPQPHAMRPEVIDALEEAARARSDYISITAGYRDVAMQYYSRWYNEHCDSSFDAAIPGQSNHQGGRAVDVRYYDFWWDTLLEHGFDHPISTDAPHFELVGTAAFRRESEDLKTLSVLAFQRLWNRNHPDDPLVEDGVYGDDTKLRLGASPVEGFPIGACPAGTGGDVGGDTGADVAEDVGFDVGHDAAGDADAGADAASDASTDVGEVGSPDASAPDAGDGDALDRDGSLDGDAGSDVSRDAAVADDAGADGVGLDAPPSGDTGPVDSAPPLQRVSLVDDSVSGAHGSGCSLGAAPARGDAPLMIGLALAFGAGRRRRRAGQRD